MPDQPPDAGEHYNDCQSDNAAAPDLYTLTQIDLSADDQAHLDLAYQLLSELGLRRRARLAKAALQHEEEVGQCAIEERT
jgi:hypothetical protein